ncbi:MAG TPA: adenylate/guanylate cyclase domain-containing protein [Gemmatimonadaceae bacterium]|nr:adenylate/guanylate cyclase domain-containing protein [Gemmatimonadaceae bacterium]
MPLKLVAADGVTSYELHDGAMQVIGRAVQCDISIIDPTISRRHAELVPDDKGLLIRDLGSSNGTFINGAKITEQRAAAGDNVTFGKLAFKLVALAPPAAQSLPPALDAPARPGATIVRQLPVRGKTGELAAAIGLGSSPSGEQKASATTATALVQQKLAMLLEVAKGLSKAMTVDSLLDKIARSAFDVLAVDRTAILLIDDRGALVPKISRDRKGGESPRAVPQSIARTAMEEKVAIASDDAGEDQRFGGQSILMQQVRSAMCAPLVGSEERVLGVLYVDSNSLTRKFTDDDLEFLIAFAGIAASNLENSQYAERLKREAVVRSNFERFFTPHLAARIANAPDAVKLGGDKRVVTVLFSDIRGFTALSETMNPDDMARLLTEYFTEMVDCVFQHGGTLDKFIGDAVMAQWGAPLGEPDDPDRALAAAIAMMNALDRLNAQWRIERRPELHMGIGINSGEAFAGNIGSERRLEYTVIGDTVNTASRLCGVAKAGEILVSDSLRKSLHTAPAMEQTEPLELKNKSQPVTVFRIKR